ncbi:hypothetical protein SMACR_03065 [Sordaria macrospora]|uniref:WGS project CABT00000000 data, contig 2.7 n=2 Tax=Sordaria macrospora TaxID=5147 RepID=F7VUB8_SORMK|nr:uncharacterized protein SMAC_03065 [Sordaria macrospora k-hell]KAA8632482.1 hypothetical protein SMACR_03065 [Sordaria macrospora]WPJ61902.1 hypothetical protein SMAC4_03065 [Sordaria macrospora]CCC09106.1 unnamed protein product [Sordaria macrospora k-hell]
MSSTKVDSSTAVERCQASVWHEMKDYIDASMKKTDISSIVPFANCYICLGELDIFGIPSVGSADNARAACFLPCGHFFCVTCWKTWIRKRPEPTRHDIGPTTPIPQAGLQGVHRLASMELGVYNKYGQSKPGQEKKPTWGRWPKELDYMLKQRGWTKGVEFVDWKKAETGPAIPEPSDETPSNLQALNQFLNRISRYWKNAITGQTTDTEDPETLALSVDWKSSQRALDNGLRLCDMEGMGPYYDWDELLEAPVWRARGISKVACDRWGQAFGREVQAHALGGVLEGPGLVIMQTDNFSLCVKYKVERIPRQGEAIQSRWPLWLLRSIRAIPIHVRSAMMFGLVLFSFYFFCSVMVSAVTRSWDLDVVGRRQFGNMAEQRLSNASIESLGIL